jgi:hypothetical protein
MCRDRTNQLTSLFQVGRDNQHIAALSWPGIEIRRNQEVLRAEGSGSNW